MLADRLRRAWIPSAVVAVSRWRQPQRLLWGKHKPLRLELFFAFDDPYAAIALPGLLRLIAQRPVQLQLYPLLTRGIAQDPAAQARAQQALIDASRLARRVQQPWYRHAALSAEDCAFLAHWCEAARDQSAQQAAFAAEALQLLWQYSEGPLNRQPYAELYRRLLHREPPQAQACMAALAANAQRLLKKGHWESPALWLAGEWFFAHERLPQIAARLDELNARVGS
ncbi:hypothetical protein SAMN04488038_11281 [Solimonas aquatica]|uniref:Uncharacterized protein n=1 Tax=Solimonas aquatica TaxID=489703 RepID=A0A1H9JUI4_9GAMM|nr:hypothetical protein [Solimonas aquatica]SEQ90576.1 hypothetical protein SAMN04488038_11281 [Solimonas aquatica]